MYQFLIAKKKKSNIKKNVTVVPITFIVMPICNIVYNFITLNSNQNLFKSN